MQEDYFDWRPTGATQQDPVLQNKIQTTSDTVFTEDPELTPALTLSTSQLPISQAPGNLTPLASASICVSLHIPIPRFSEY